MTLVDFIMVCTSAHIFRPPVKCVAKTVSVPPFPDAYSQIHIGEIISDRSQNCRLVNGILIEYVIDP